MDYVDLHHSLMKQCHFDFEIPQLIQAYTFIQGLTRDVKKYVRLQDPKELHAAISDAQHFTTSEDQRDISRDQSRRASDSSGKRDRQSYSRQRENRHRDSKRSRNDKEYQKDFMKGKCRRCGHFSHTANSCYAGEEKIKSWIKDLERNGYDKPPGETNWPRANKPDKRNKGSSHYLDAEQAQTYLHQRHHCMMSIARIRHHRLLKSMTKSNSCPSIEAISFIDSGCSFNAVSAEYAAKTGMLITESNNPLIITVGGNQKLRCDRKVAQIDIIIDGIGAYKSPCFVMETIPEQCEILLGIEFLSLVNPEIDWANGTMKSRMVEPTKGWEEVLNYHTLHPFISESGLKTKIISQQAFKKTLRKYQHSSDMIFFNITVREALPRKSGPKTDEEIWLELKCHPMYQMLSKYKATVFNGEIPTDKPINLQGYEHRIELKDTTPVVTKQHRLSPDQKNELEKWITEIHKAGLIRSSTSPYSSAVLVLKKPKGGYRIVHDYRQINEKTNIPQYPIPRREDILDSMVGSKWFSSMDLLSGYYQLNLRDADQHITAFSTPSGHYEYVVTPQGLSGAPASFNRYMQHVLLTLEDCNGYFDDIYVHTKSAEVNNHIRAVEKVLERLQRHHLRIRLSKCLFLREELPVLGDIAGRNGIRMDPNKTEIIRNWPAPKTKRQLKSFLGTIVYNARFCKDYGRLAGPLHSAGSGFAKNQPITLTEHQKDCFEKLKIAMCETPILGIPDSQLPFGIRTDASQFAIGGTLFNILTNGTERVLAYYGRKMTDAEKNYDVRETELLAILHAIRTWRPYLIDQPFVCETDHQSLQSILTQPKCSRRLARWLNELSEYPITFKWIPGSINTTADGLSRHPEFEGNDPNPSKVDLKAFLKSLNIMEDVLYAHIETSEHTLFEQIRLLTPQDLHLKKIMQHLSCREGRTAEASRESYQNFIMNEKGLVLLQSSAGSTRICVPRDPELLERLMWEHHDSPTKGHMGHEKTLYDLRLRYYWKGMDKSIRQYINTCEKCQRIKVRQSKEPGLLHPLPIPSQRGQSISMDFLTGLPVTEKAHDSIWVIVDRLTKRLCLIASKKTDDAQTCAQRFYDGYIRWNGLPSDIISDRDKVFTSAFWTCLLSMYGTTGRPSSAFRPQTDGQSETYNKVILDYLKAYVGSKNDWDLHLTSLEIAANDRKHSSTNMTPFEADRGFPMRSPIDLAINQNIGRNVPHAREFVLKCRTDLIKMQEQIAISQHRMQHYYNVNRPTQSFKIGAPVLLSTANLKLTHAAAGKDAKRKLSPRWIGPFTVIGVTTPDTYKLELPAGLRLHNEFHTSMLKAYQKDSSITRLNPPGAALINAEGEEVLLVDKVLSIRRNRQTKSIEVLVRWLGYTAKHDSWEPVTNMDSAKGLIWKLVDSHPKYISFKKDLNEDPKIPTLRRKKKSRTQKRN